MNRISCLACAILSILACGCQDAVIPESRVAPQMPTTSQPAKTVGGKAAGSAAANYVYPLKISANGRYLVDQNGKPFRIQGDSAQSLIANLTYAEAETYFEDRRKRGFNTVNINLLEHKFALNAPANRNGDVPFLKPGDFSTPNEAYFAFADSILELAASKGIVVSLAAMYLGIRGEDEGWWGELTSPANPQEVSYKFGVYVGNRYKRFNNILWIIGGDYFPPAGSQGEIRLHRYLEGIKAAGATQLWAGDWAGPCLSTDEKAFAPLMDLNAVYTSGDPKHRGETYLEARKGFSYSPPHPAYLKETGYEEENWVPGDRASVRKYQYWAILGGATEGGLFGNRDVWGFASEKWWSGFPFGRGLWQRALDSPGTLDMMRLGQFLDSVPWYDLIPSGLGGMKQLVSQGGGASDGQDYVAAEATADRSVLVAYVPPVGKGPITIAIDMSALRGSVRARWFDPTSGVFAEVPGSPFPNQGTRRFTTPGNNSGGATDWVLLLQVK
jgi:uncharacterized protein DUF4038/collagenase-like protein with putative collagen-binding domain